MPKFVVVNSFLHKHVLHAGGEVLDLSEYEGRKMGHNVARVADEAANVVKQESAKADKQKAAAKKNAPKAPNKRAPGPVPPPPPDRVIKKGGA